MIFHLPLYLTTSKHPVTGIKVYHARPLFFERPSLRDEQLGRLMLQLGRRLQEHLTRLGRQDHHDELARWAFSPPTAQHRLNLTLELRRSRPKCRFFLVVFAHRGKRIAFCPAIDDLWFEYDRGEDLASRATEVLTDYFRDLEKQALDDAKGNDPPVYARPATYAMTGTAWITTLDLDITPASKLVRKPVLPFLFLGDAETMSGAEELRRVGRCLDWHYPDHLERATMREREVAELSKLLDHPDRRPVLLIGPRLVGKTTILEECIYRRVARRRSPHRDKANTWLIAPQRLISGMSYVGQWENRLLAILKEIHKRDHILYFDDLLGLFRAGQTGNSSLNVAHVLKPYIERRDLRLVAEITPEALHILREQDRGLADQFHLLPIGEPTDRDNLQIMIQTQRQDEDRHGCVFDLEVLPTVLDLTRRYVRDAAYPGKAARMLRQLAVRGSQLRRPKEEKARLGEMPPRPVLSRQDVYQEFQAQTGLAMQFLDPRGRLERREILEALGDRVVGQPHALEAVADVLAIAKARLNDPDRPLATFLFLGPTGVGKTECAKAIAHYLFGDADKLLRFDMNEYVDPGSAARLVGTFHQPEGLFTAAIRRQPFAVVLLDEIEKADPEVFDLLLQVLGEGRLTDALGRTADFTNAIVLLTSNLGVREAETNLGFGPTDVAAAATAYQTTAERFFRPEFFNRLDRVIPFRRLERQAIRKIARLLVQQVLKREGFQHRRCLIQVDDQAIEQIVAVGFDPILGARAMKRAVERYLVQPVATRLANIPVDQFTLIEVYPATAKVGADVLGSPSLAVAVQPLKMVKALPRAEAVDVTPAERFRETQRVFNALTARFALLRPEGVISRHDLDSRHDRYFTLKEHAERIEAGLRQIKDSIDRNGVPNYATALSLSTHGRGIWRVYRNENAELSGLLGSERAGIADFQDTIRELAAAADVPEPSQEIWDLLDQQLRLLALMTDPSPTADSVLLYLITPVDPPPFVKSLNLATRYVEAFRSPLGQAANLLEVDDLPFHGQVILLQGINVAALACLEVGTHLLSPRHASFCPVGVYCQPVPAGTTPEAILQQQTEQYRQWRSQLAAELGSLDSNPFRAGPIVRLYVEGQTTVDPRTGLLGADLPTPEQLASFLLATLPPVNVPEGAQADADATALRDRAERLLDDADWDR